MHFVTFAKEDKTIEVAQFLQILYNLKVLEKGPNSRVPDVLHKMLTRGYYSEYTMPKRNSYGPGAPPKLTIDDCYKWASMFYFEKLSKGNAAGNKDWEVVPIGEGDVTATKKIESAKSSDSKSKRKK